MSKNSAIITLAISMILTMIIANKSFGLNKVEGDSMYPTYKNGQYIVIGKSDYKKSKPLVNDVIAFKVNNTSYIKRIIAIEGNIVDYKDGYIAIDNIPTIKTEFIGNIKYPIRIEQDQYFVIGDNYNNSRDSRLVDIGLVNINSIAGKVK